MLLGVATLLESASRVLLVVTAIVISRSGGARLIAMTLASAALLAAARVTDSVLRSSVRRDLLRAVVETFLESDVLEPPSEDQQRVVFDGLHYGSRLLAEEVPRLAGDGVACLVILPLLVGVLERRTFAMAAGAFVVAMLGALAVRSVARRLEQRTAAADEQLYRIVLHALHGRLEIVARGAENAYAQTFRQRLEEYRALVQRTGFFTAALGRVPVAAAALLVFIVLVLDEGARTGLQSSVAGPLLALGAAFPTLRGAAVGFVGFARGPVLVRPFAELLTLPRRPELATRAAARDLTLPAVVRLDNVSFEYAAAGRRVLQGLSFVWDPREPLVIAGPNGAGKSTLLRLLLGLRPPTSGTIRFGDVDLAAIDVVALRRRACLLPQRTYLGEPYTSVRSAMQLARPEAVDADMIAALESVRVAATLDTSIGRLSAGQLQRVALARALLVDAAFYLFDEPDADLDNDGIRVVADLLRDLSAKGKMVAVAAHGAELRALTSTPIVIERAG